MENPIAMKYKLESLFSSSVRESQVASARPRPEIVVLTNPKIQVAGASS